MINNIQHDMEPTKEEIFLKTKNSKLRKHTVCKNFGYEKKLIGIPTWYFPV